MEAREAVIVDTVRTAVGKRKGALATWHPSDLLGLALGALGPGEWSLDNAFGFTWVDGWSGLTTTAIAGLGGALAILALFWRPAREESAG